MPKTPLPLTLAGTPSKHKGFLTEVLQEFKQNGIRTSVFLDPSLKQVEGAKVIGADRVELYTEAFAHHYSLGNKEGGDSLL